MSLMQGKWLAEASVPNTKLNLGLSEVFYEGDNSPPFIDIDDYHFEDAAGFDPDLDQDIIFRPAPQVGYVSRGMKLLLQFCMSTGHTGNVVLKLDYRIKDLGDPIGAGAEFSQTFTINPLNVADTIEVNEQVQIPAGRVTATTETIHCRLTRLGTDPGDTHTGIFCLVDTVPKVI